MTKHRIHIGCQISNLDEVVNGLQVEEVVVGHVDADAEVEAGVAAIDDFVVPELDEVGVLRVAD
jgi:hypothetical protein